MLELQRTTLPAGSCRGELGPSVTVVIPTFNRRHILSAAIDSALSQAGVDVDIVVVDDNSTDGTVDWVQRIWADQRVQAIRNTGLKGPAGGRNTGLQAASAEYVALLDSDDSFLPGHLAAAVGVMEQHSQVGVVFGRARYLKRGSPVDYMGPNFTRKLGLAPKTFEDDQLVVLGPDFFEHLLIQGCWFNLSSVVLSRAAAQQRMCEDLRVAEDYEFWVRLSRSHRFACLKNEQIEYTLGDDNISFESGATTEGHAPQLLRAYGHMLRYQGLTANDLACIHRRMADELFNWAWRTRKGHKRWAAAQLHLQSLRHGRYMSNLLGLLKCLV